MASASEPGASGTSGTSGAKTATTCAYTLSGTSGGDLTQLTELTSVGAYEATAADLTSEGTQEIVTASSSDDELDVFTGSDG
ncbi:hypothetical protein [Streptomyces sp. NPDC001480]|uniref:hypothetical protein n=1 Tax=Streptomyces sp. NPDC001480 TaxID=3364577 RepID=UPI0036B0D003